jgi:hypothetical protein
MVQKKDMPKTTRGKIKEAAKRDARAVKSLAGEAVSAAAMAAAGVVLQGVAKALGGRGQKPQEGRVESNKKTTNKRALTSKQPKTNTKPRKKIVKHTAKRAR